MAGRIVRFVFLVWWLGWSLPASAYTLSGIVYGGQTPLADTVVTVRDAALGTTVATTTTDANGGYSITGLSGRYNLTVTPPAGTVYRESVIDSVDLSAGDAVQHAFLLGGLRSLNGTLYANDGVTPANAVTIKVHHADTGLLLESVETDDDGAFHFSLEAGEYVVGAGKSECAATSFDSPRYFELRKWWRVTVAADTRVELTLPAMPTITGYVVDEAGDPQAGVRIESSALYYGSDISYYATNDSDSCPVYSDADGRYQLTVLAGDTLLRLLPPEGSAVPPHLLP